MISFDLKIFILFTAIFTLVEWGYALAAKKFRLYAPRTDHSMHRHEAVTTGGVLFPLAGIVAYVLGREVMPTEAGLVIICALAIGAVSFADDLWQITPGGRLMVQILAAAVTFAFMGSADHWLEFLVAVIGTVGYINASNFMDGADGMLGLTSLVTLLMLQAIFASPEFASLRAENEWLVELVYILISAVIAFLIFNLIGRPRVFAGDVGSITLGYFIAFIATIVIQESGQWCLAVIGAVFVAETLMTVGYRLFGGKNILKSHKEHVYQLFVSRLGWSGVAISFGYAALQAVIDAGWLLLDAEWRNAYCIAVYALLIVIHGVLRSKLSKLPEKD